MSYIRSQLPVTLPVDNFFRKQNKKNKEKLKPSARQKKKLLLKPKNLPKKRLLKKLKKLRSQNER